MYLKMLKRLVLLFGFKSINCKETSLQKRRLVSDAKGATLIEYALILGLVSMVAYTGLAAVGNAVNAKFAEIASMLGGTAQQTSLAGNSSLGTAPACSVGSVDGNYKALTCVGACTNPDPVGGVCY